LASKNTKMVLAWIAVAVLAEGFIVTLVNTIGFSIGLENFLTLAFVWFAAQVPPHPGSWMFVYYSLKSIVNPILVYSIIVSLGIALVLTLILAVIVTRE